MSNIIQKVAVLGAGVMGAQIAAHLSNAKIPVYLFDMNQEIAEKGLAASAKLKPAAFFNPKTINLITPLNYDEHIEKIAECAWVIEVIAERLDWKLQLFERILPHLPKDAILTSNTSGISVKVLSEKMPADLKKRFFITHFFNPPRYMRLVELIPGEETDLDTMQKMGAFIESALGKGIVYAKDTVNFIANRIGVFSMMATLAEARKAKLSVENVDNLTGTIIGHPKSATFRTADVVGLDTLAFVAMNAFKNPMEDEARAIFKVPEYLQKMLEKGMLGQKVKQGFYKKMPNREILSIDFETLDYKKQIKDRFNAIRLAKEHKDLGKKISALAFADDVAGKFIWEFFAQTFIYSANRLGEISDNMNNIDNAMRWGFAWEQGPFESWDTIGFHKVLERMRAEKKVVPDWVSKMAEKGFDSFYIFKEGEKWMYEPKTEGYVQVPRNPRSLSFQLLKKGGKTIFKDWSASIVDLGDGVAGVELHSVLQAQMNPLDGSIFNTLKKARVLVEERGFKGLVISSDAMHFSAGANLNLIINSAVRQNWKAIDDMSKSMQDVLQSLRFAPFPVVAAPFNLAIGGGYETIGASDRIVAHAELYTGLVEFGVGLIPGGGGNLRVLMNLSDKMAPARPGPFPISRKAFEIIGFAKVSASAKEAQALGYLRRSDKLVMNRDFLLADAKAEVLAMAENYSAPEEREDLILPGPDGQRVLEASIRDFVLGGKISPHDGKIATKLAGVLTGGAAASPFKPVSEQYLLDIERDAFISLCGEKLTQDRIEYMLKKGKPLRN